MENPVELLDGVVNGDHKAIARCISLVEDRSSEVRPLLAALHHRTGRAHLIGVTGPPGTGKSTLVNAMVKVYRRQGMRIGIIAVDPTSPFSGGALLGDRIRMRDLAGDAGVFMRSMASRGSLGGLAYATADAAKILDAAGFDNILVETVGVGQAEVDVAQAAHTTVVLQTPNLGDDIQALKAGLVEIADIFVVNKADRDGADRVVADLNAVLDLAPDPRQGGAGPSAAWRPPVLKTIALSQEGIRPLFEANGHHREYLDASGQWAQRERIRARQELSHLVHACLVGRFEARISDARWEGMVDRVARRDLDPYAAAEELLRADGVAGKTGEPK